MDMQQLQLCKQNTKVIPHMLTKLKGLDFILESEGKKYHTYEAVQGQYQI